MEMDWSVGQIINALQTKDLLHDTLIFFTSDNGPFLERGKRGGFAGYDLDSSLPPSQSLLKGGKGQTWEGGIRVPGFFLFFFSLCFLLFLVEKLKNR